MERAAGACCQQQGFLLDIFLALVLGARQRLARPPIVGHLVIIPLCEDRHLGIERAHVRVEQIVFVVAAELGERSAGFAFSSITMFFQISPFGIFCSSRIGTVGVDIVAAVDEEIRQIAQHGGVGAHARRASSSMPQPCPAVSPDHKNEMERWSSARCESGRPSPRRQWSARQDPGSGYDRRCSCPAGRPSISALAVKSDSGSASTKTGAVDRS